MKRFGRLLFNAFAVVCIVLCVAVAVIWVARISYSPHRTRKLSHRWALIWAIEPRGRYGHGELMMEDYHYLPAPIIGPQSGPGQSYSPAELQWLKQFGSRQSFDHWGFHLGKMPVNGRSGSQAVMFGYSWWLGIPDWLAILVLAIPPFIAWRLYRRRIAAERIEQGLCGICGYDLRATPSRCPECGTIPPMK